MKKRLIVPNLSGNKKAEGRKMEVRRGEAAQKRMSPEQIEEFSSRHGIERGWIWLYENGFKRRVPVKIQEKIENLKCENVFGRQA